MRPLLNLLFVLPSVRLLENSRVKRLSAYDPANLLLPYKDDIAPKQSVRVYRPMLNVVLAKEARTTNVNGKEIPLWLGDGFVRIPKRPVLSSAVVSPSSAEQNIEIRFGGGSRPHYPYPRVPGPFRKSKARATTLPPVMFTLGPGRTATPRKPFEAAPATFLQPRFPNRDTLIVFKKAKRQHHGRRIRPLL